MLSSIFSTDRHCRHLELSHRGFSWSEQIGNFHSTCYQSLRSATLFLYALHNVTMTMPLENRMRTPHNLQRMLILNVSFNVFIVHDIRVPRLQQMHARCLRHCSQESSQESVDVPWVDVFFFFIFIGFWFIFILFFFFHFNSRYAKIRSIFIFLKNFTLMKFKTSVILIQSLKWNFNCIRNIWDDVFKWNIQKIFKKI